MIGLIKKDFLLIKANFKSMVMIFIIYLVLAYQGNLDTTFLVPVVGITLFISTFSYDDFNNFNAYAITLPNGRKDVVRAKYIASIIMMIILGIISLILETCIYYTKTNGIILDEILSSLMGTILSNIIIISFLYPIIFKYGSTKGRIILFVAVFGSVGLGAVAFEYADMTFVINAMGWLDNYWVIAIPSISVILLGISYLISYTIYQKKEF